MRYLLVFIVFSLSFSSCSSESNDKEVTSDRGKEQVNENFNFIITPDLSNRITPNLYDTPVNDTVLINSIYNNYYPNIYKVNNRVIGQRDRIGFLFTNPQVINNFGINLNNLSIDYGDKNQAERIEYLANGGNRKDLANTRNEIKKIYESAINNSTGGDIYNYFQTQIVSSVLKKNAIPVEVNGTIVKNNFRNIIILFTDGYIEAGIYGNRYSKGNKSIYLSKSRIDKFRKDFIASGSTSMEEFFNESGYGIIPIDNKELENVEVLVVQMYDRSLSRTTGNQTVSPNDFEIMKLFWSDWLKKSGVKHFRLLKASNSKEDFMNNLVGFLKEPISN